MLTLRTFWSSLERAGGCWQHPGPALHTTLYERREVQGHAIPPFWHGSGRASRFFRYRLLLWAFVAPRRAGALGDGWEREGAGMSKRRLPAKFFQPIEPEIFRLAFAVFASATAGTLSTPDPTEQHFALVQDDGSVESFHFTDIPITRYLMAVNKIIDHLPHPQRMSILWRLWEIGRLLKYPSLAPWIRYQDNGLVEIHDCLISACAEAPLDPRTGKYKLGKLVKAARRHQAKKQGEPS